MSISSDAGPQPQYQLTLFKPEEGRLSPSITTGTPNVFHLPASLNANYIQGFQIKRINWQKIGRRSILLQLFLVHPDNMVILEDKKPDKKYEKQLNQTRNQTKEWFS